MVSALDYLFKSGISVKKGIERLAKVYCWPNVPTTADKDKYEFRALIEFVIFKEFVMTPFFKLLFRYSFKHIASLYKHLSSLPMDKTCMLTYKEAYIFMRDILGVDNVKLILDQTSYPSNVYNAVLRSLEEENYNLFFSAFDKSDYTDMMQVLWQMRYILTGEKGNWNNFNPSIPHLKTIQYLPYWINFFDNYSKYFEEHEDDDEDEFLDDSIYEIVRKLLEKRGVRKRIHEPTNKPDKTFEEDNKKELDRLFGESLFKSQWKELLTEFTNNSNFQKRTSVVNKTSIEKRARLILTRNVILHKDNIMKEYGIDSSKIYYQFLNEQNFFYKEDLKDYKEDLKDYEEDLEDYEEGLKDLGTYILYYTGEMQNVYNLIKDFFQEQDRQAIKQLLDRCPKRDDEPCVIDDYSITKNKEYIRVRNSKIKGSTREEKEKNYKKSLEILYNVLVENDYICSETDKELFIYRFSGYGNPKRPLKKIKWNKKNVLLGHIVRCLISDKANTPKDSGIIATFFETESGKTINLSTAKHILVADFDKEKSNIDQNFVEAVEILRRCGFVDVEYTSKRR